QFPHHAQLLFVEQLALELSEQLDVAGDASSRCDPRPPAFPHSALVYIATENGERCSQTDLSLIWGSASTRSANDEPPARDVKAELKRKSWGSASTRFGERARNQQPSLPHAALVGIATGRYSATDGLPLSPGNASSEISELETGLFDVKAEVFGPFEVPEHVLFNLLPYLSVDDLMEWRVTSWQTRSPRVLIQHLSEMGRLDRRGFVGIMCPTQRTVVRHELQRAGHSQSSIFLHIGLPWESIPTPSTAKWTRIAGNGRSSSVSWRFSSTMH
ncbi:unnamed protein product, partial [Symbiodinium sp. KB8]